MTTREQGSDLKALGERLAEGSMKGLWEREDELWREPNPFGGPKLWKWAEVRAGLDAAARLVPTESGLAFVLVGIAMMAMLQAGWLE